MKHLEKNLNFFVVFNFDTWVDTMQTSSNINL